jgi:hypothetical protein
MAPGWLARRMRASVTLTGGWSLRTAASTADALRSIALMTIAPTSITLTSPVALVSTTAKLCLCVAGMVLPRSCRDDISVPRESAPPPTRPASPRRSYARSQLQ